jgi:histidine ammonia-lyase
MTVALDGRSLTLEDFAKVVSEEKVRVGAPSIRRMEKFRALLEKKLSSGEVVYGVNTGFGSLSDKAVPIENVKQHQLNLIRSHSAGVGRPMPKEVVRGAMLLRLNSLLNGNSAIRATTAALLADMLNNGVTPMVPTFGSLGASGDLVPSAHVALAMVGEGKAFVGGTLVDSAKALRESGLKPIELGVKEGLSLINGTCFTTALAALCIVAGRSLLDAANCSVALTAEALHACTDSFDARLMHLKNNRGQERVAKRIRQMLRGSQRVRAEPVPQDPYSIRCAPQVHGSVQEALDFAERITVREMNSVSDNPVLLEDGSVLHGGNFHAQVVAMASDLLSFTVAYIGVISLARIHLLLSRSPPERKYMANRPGLESGLMILEYTASALAADNAKQSNPLSTYPANVSSGIEDHASYGVNAGSKAISVAENVSKILAIEMICASNLAGADLRSASRFCRGVYSKVRAVSPLLAGDRSMAAEVENLSQEILRGDLLAPTRE